MKLILVPSNPKHGPRVSISIANDGGVLSDFLSDVVVPALVAYGWHPQSIQDAMRDIEVPGAVAEVVEDELVPERREGPVPPEGYTIVGHGIVGPDPDEALEDLMFRAAAGNWYATPYADGGDHWYAARNGSETLAKLQTHIAPL